MGHKIDIRKKGLSDVLFISLVKSYICNFKEAVAFQPRN